MDFLPHGHDFSLPNRWVEVVLHFLFQLNFPFPEKDLSLGFDNLCEDFGLLFLELGNVVLELETLIFELLQFLFELVLNVEVIVGELGLVSCVLVVEVVELIHFEVQVLEGHVQLSDIFLMGLHVLVQSHFLLLQD